MFEIIQSSELIGLKIDESIPLLSKSIVPFKLYMCIRDLEIILKILSFCEQYNWWRYVKFSTNLMFIAVKTIPSLPIVGKQTLVPTLSWIILNIIITKIDKKLSSTSWTVFLTNSIQFNISNFIGY